MIGRADVKVPGRRTTFRVHCGVINNEYTVRFEILKTGSNEPSGYYFYGDPNWDDIYAKQNPSSTDRKANFVLKRWRGPVTAIKSLQTNNWLTFFEDDDGLVSVERKPLSQYPEFPHLYDAFNLELGKKGLGKKGTNC